MKKRKYSRKNKSPKNDCCLPELPPELISEILARTPVKPLLKFRCVCKSWRSLIDSNDFVSLHRKLYSTSFSDTRILVFQQRQRSYDYILTVRHSDTFKKVGNEVGKFPLTFWIFESCNGLLLIEHEDTFKIWNPFIRKCLTIPLCPIDKPGCLLWYRLGFAASTNDYKVVVIDIQTGKIAVYSVNDHCWQVKTNGINFDEGGFGVPLFHDCPTPIVFPDARAFYLVLCNNQHESKVIFSYDYDTEKSKFIKLPDAVSVNDGNKLWFLFRFGESIAIFIMSSNNDYEYDIWVMEDDDEKSKETWKLKASRKMNLKEDKLFKSVITGYENSSNFMVLFNYIQQNDSFVMVKSSRFKFTDKLMSYNLTSQEIKQLGKSLCGKISFDKYVESLALHRGVEGQTLVSFP